MPSRGRKFITEFLLSSLNEKRFGSRLMWLDTEKKVFQIQWNHKSASDWTAKDAAVFAAWDQRKGHYKPDDKEYYTKSKQRFRAALYKFIKHKYITELYNEDKYVKVFCIGDGKNICESYVARNEKENKSKSSYQIAEKHNPGDLVVDVNTMNDFLFADFQESFPTHHPFDVINEEQVSDNTDDFSRKTSHLDCYVPQTDFKIGNHLDEMMDHDYIRTIDNNQKKWKNGSSKEMGWPPVNLKNDEYEMSALLECI